ncbi:MAG: hypothetical protein ACD_46C00270G0005 [uncultured bacterium]|nr:MAG: hypothetical protein ACD_46C00270G0005 [uncultured bacterium]
MKKLILLTAVALFSSYSFAASPQVNNIANQLSLAFKKHATMKSPSHNDIAMVYGGQDVAHRPTLALHTVSA